MASNTKKTDGRRAARDAKLKNKRSKDEQKRKKAEGEVVIS
jgi:hypothetical protein